MAGTKKSVQKRRRGQLQNSAASEGEEGTVELYEIEKILARRFVKATGQFKYFIKWMGYPDSENSWEPEQWLDQYANWLADFNRAEDGVIQSQRLQDTVTILLSGSKATPTTFAGVDISGLGVVLPGMDTATSSGNGNEMNAPGSKDLIQGAEDADSAMAVVVENADDPMDGFGYVEPAPVLAAQSKPTGTDPVIMSTGSVPHADIFHENQTLLKKNKFLKTELAKEGKRIQELEADLKTVKGSRRLMQTKLAHERIELKVALDENRQHKKELEMKSEENCLLDGQLKKIHRENKQLVESLTEQTRSVSTLEEKVESLESINDNLQEKLFQQQEMIRELEAKLELGCQNPIPYQMNRDEIIQLHGALDEAQHEHMKLKANLAALTTLRDQQAKRLAEKHGLVSTLERELGGARAMNQQLKGNLMGKDMVIMALERDMDALQIKGEKEKERPTVKEKEIRSHYRRRLAEMKDGWGATKDKNVRLNLKVGKLIRELSKREDSLHLVRKLRWENMQLKNELSSKGAEGGHSRIDPGSSSSSEGSRK